jgi:ASC-1-like (ASCH) protein
MLTFNEVLDYEIKPIYEFKTDDYDGNGQIIDAVYCDMCGGVATLDPFENYDKSTKYPECDMCGASLTDDFETIETAIFRYDYSFREFVFNIAQLHPSDPRKDDYITLMLDGAFHTGEGVGSVMQRICNYLVDIYKHIIRGTSEFPKFKTNGCDEGNREFIKNIVFFYTRTHKMKLTNEWFDKIDRKPEFRLFDEKRQKIRNGDHIVFTNIETGEKVTRKVVGSHINHKGQSPILFVREINMQYSRYSFASSLVGDALIDIYGMVNIEMYGLIVIHTESVD